MSLGSMAKRAVRATGARRGHLVAVRMCCERAWLTLSGGHSSGPRSRILCYHSVGTPSWGVNDVSPERFRKQIEDALEAGYTFVPAQQLASGTQREKQLAITFDDGLSSVSDNAAAILKDYHIPWTMFVVSDWADGNHQFGDGVVLDWRRLQHLAEAGATLGSHSATHPNFAHLPVQEAAEELHTSREVIRSRLGLAVTEFAIPYGQSRNWHEDATQAAREAGYETIYAQSEDRRPIGTVPRTFITRFDGERVFRAALAGSFDSWEEWI